MKRAEIQRRYDEIVAFAEVEKFLETAVKHYSSGMYMRLAFSVAAHLEPEILLVDEVLAVGDAAFQRKCLNKMEAVGKHGRTVFFVSHNMPAITRLCPRAIMLDRGTVYRDGSAPEVVSAYLSSGLGTIAHREWPNGSEAPGNEIVRLRAVRAHINDGELSQTFDVRMPISLEIDYDVLTPGQVLSPNFHVFNEDGTCLFVAIDSSPEWRRTPRPAGRYRTMALIPGNFLAEGTHVVHVAMSTFQPLSVHFNERDAVAFQVIDRMEGESARAGYAGHLPGVMRPLLEWKTTIVEQS
jgi:lipopolysaccharide transport system ATP-binding protein